MSLPSDVLHLVVAYSHRDFVMWCREQQVSPLDKRVKYISQPHDLRGYKLSERVVLVKLSGWFDRIDAYDVAREVRVLEVTSDQG